MNINNLRCRVARYKADDRAGMILNLDVIEALIERGDRRQDGAVTMADIAIRLTRKWEYDRAKR